MTALLICFGAIVRLLVALPHTGLPIAAPVAAAFLLCGLPGCDCPAASGENGVICVLSPELETSPRTRSAGRGATHVEEVDLVATTVLTSRTKGFAFKAVVDCDVRRRVVAGSLCTCRDDPAPALTSLCRGAGFLLGCDLLPVVIGAVLDSDVAGAKAGGGAGNRRGRLCTMEAVMGVSFS